eukprot:CAMPEP_0117673816 /NCGR_PEP_ID=MMETSP0804-20121206/14687_1 /TAXON_ID=1074897 /ORGANISM="Tetraselmis astigmatica, Strain CCMP880" /LENGTH=811 /DNA_ID=CAMNT_0005482605 /DNA_START=99 /DNA_END=2534 /DNA_ORIENTATION=-
MSMAKSFKTLTRMDTTTGDPSFGTFVIQQLCPNLVDGGTDSFRLPSDSLTSEDARTYDWGENVLSCVEDIADAYLYRRQDKFVGNLCTLYYLTKLATPGDEPKPPPQICAALNKTLKTAGAMSLNITVDESMKKVDKEFSSEATIIQDKTIVPLEVAKFGIVVAGCMQDCWELYLGRNWNRAHMFELANNGKVSKFRKATCSSSGEAADGPERLIVLEVDDASLAGFEKETSWICCLFYSNNAKSHVLLRKFFRAAAEVSSPKFERLMQGAVKFAQVNVTTCVKGRKISNGKAFPEIHMVHHGKSKARMDKDKPLKSYASIIEFICSTVDEHIGEEGIENRRCMSGWEKTTGDGLKRSAQENWARLRKAVLREVVMNRMNGRREFTSVVEKMRILGVGTGDSKRPPGAPPPTIIFMGGGMGSGKSTVVSVLQKMEYWRNHHSRFVVVEADALKMKDPVFLKLTKLGDPDPSQVVHGDSVEAAEQILLNAVQQRRDIVFDGTMMWAPFVMQTVEMIRDNMHNYKRGPGYVVNEDGSTTENYWEIVEECAPKEPYHLWMVGVTVDPSSAVRRGIVRKLVTTRGVPIPSQLRSHQLFSEAFPKYVEIFDKVSLYDNSQPDLLLADAPNEPALIAYKEGLKSTLLIDQEKYTNFLKKASLNHRSASADEMFVAEKSITEEADAEAAAEKAPQPAPVEQTLGGYQSVAPKKRKGLKKLKHNLRMMLLGETSLKSKESREPPMHPSLTQHNSMPIPLRTDKLLSEAPDASQAMKQRSLSQSDAGKLDSSTSVAARMKMAAEYLNSEAVLFAALTRGM